VKTSLAVQQGRVTEKKTGQSKKSLKCYISSIWGEIPLNRFQPKFAWWLTFPTQSRVQSFKVKFSGITI